MHCRMKCHASMVRNCVQSHLICNGYLTLLIITFLSYVTVPEPLYAAAPYQAIDLQGYINQSPVQM
jgi:hypothetical protein